MPFLVLLEGLRRIVYEFRACALLDRIRELDFLLEKFSADAPSRALGPGTVACKEPIENATRDCTVVYPDDNKHDMHNEPFVSPSFYPQSHIDS